MALRYILLIDITKFDALSLECSRVKLRKTKNTYTGNSTIFLNNATSKYFEGIFKWSSHERQNVTMINRALKIIEISVGIVRIIIMVIVRFTENSLAIISNKIRSKRKEIIALKREKYQKYTRRLEYNM